MDIYARAGAALVRVDYKDDTGGETHKFNDLKVSPVFAGGLEYAILPELALRLEYQWVARVSNFGKAERKKAEAYYGPNNYDFRHAIRCRGGARDTEVWPRHRRHRAL